MRRSKRFLAYQDVEKWMISPNDVCSLEDCKFLQKRRTQYRKSENRVVDCVRNELSQLQVTCKVQSSFYPVGRHDDTKVNFLEKVRRKWVWTYRFYCIVELKLLSEMLLEMINCK